MRALRHPAMIRGLAYLALALVMARGFLGAPHRYLLGFPNVDATDTVMLRGLFTRLLRHPLDAPMTDGIYFPSGFPVLHLLPNWLDHLTAAPLVWLLPFPLADNLWWLVVLTLNGLCAHRLGRRLGGTEAAGWLAGVGFLLAEPLAREANLHHAPQAMSFWAPLYLVALLDLREQPRDLRRALWAGLWLALAAQSYWYLGLFLGLGSLPLLVGLPLRTLASMGALVGAVSAPTLMPQLLGWNELPLTSGANAPAPLQVGSGFDMLEKHEIFVAQHGSDLWFWLRRLPMDLSSRSSILLLLAAALGARKLPRRLAASLAFLVLLGGLMVLGPYLRKGDDLVLWGESAVPLPFHWLGELHPVLQRLTWPERWAVLLPLGLVALAARAPRPELFALGIGLEGLILSANLPLQLTPVHTRACWAELSHTSGALLELPIRRGGLQSPRVGLHLRFHRRPVVNPVLLPPGASAPEAWRAWKDTAPLMAYLQTFEEGGWPEDPGADAVRALQADGITVIALDVEPGGVLTPGGMNRYRAGLARHLGEPIDLGCALVWWLDPAAPPPAAHEDGEAWRDEAATWLAAHPAPELDTLIRPSWNGIQRPKPTTPQ